MFVASEHRSWVLYYAIPVLKGILNKDYLEHFVLFSEAIWLLLQSCISSSDVDKAEQMLHHFCVMFPAYYGKYLYTNIYERLLLYALLFYIQNSVTILLMSTCLSILLILFGIWDHCGQVLHSLLRTPMVG